MVKFRAPLLIHHKYEVQHGLTPIDTAIKPRVSAKVRHESPHGSPLRTQGIKTSNVKECEGFQVQYHACYGINNIGKIAYCLKFSRCDV
jgi:hypothetical protein